MTNRDDREASLPPTHVEWGFQGARRAAERNDIVVVIDVLSFSTTTTSAVRAGASVYPFPYKDYERAQEFANRVGAELKTGATEGTPGRRALSPLGFGPRAAGRVYVLSSLNGATCSVLAKDAAALYVGALVNARATAHAVARRRRTEGVAVTLVPCGEQWPEVRPGEDPLRPCLEDYLGAGAILATLEGPFTPEAELCRRAYAAAGADVSRLVFECESGRELRDKGYEEDVVFSSQINTLDTVVVLADGKYVRAES